MYAFTVHSHFRHPPARASNPPLVVDVIVTLTHTHNSIGTPRAWKRSRKISLAHPRPLAVVASRARASSPRDARRRAARVRAASTHSRVARRARARATTTR
jgi:hypothetical protein